MYLSYLAIVVSITGTAFGSSSWSAWNGQSSNAAVPQPASSAAQSSSSIISASATASTGSSGTSGSPATFTNPVLETVAADPWAFRYDGQYYLLVTTSDNVTILRSDVLTDWNSAEVKLAFKAPENTSYTFDSWAPELHYFAQYDKWYIIYTADVDPDSPSPQQDMLCDYNWYVHKYLVIIRS